MGQPSFAQTPPTFFLRDSLFRRRVLAFELTRRGHPQEAYSLRPTFGLTSLDQWLNPYDRLAILGAVPTDTVASVFQRALAHASPELVTGLVPALSWWLAQGDTLAIRRFASRADSIARSDPEESASALRSYAADAGWAYLTLARADTAAAVRAFAALADSVCGFRLLDCRVPKLTEARMLAATGHDWQAAALLDQWGDLEPLAVLEWAHALDRLADRPRAARAYRFVAAIWRHADPELQPYVQEAQRRLGELLPAEDDR